MIAPLIAWGAPGAPEILLVLVVVFLLFGAKKLPELARGIGQSMNEFRKARDDFENELHKSAQTPTPEDPAKPVDEKKA